MKLSSIGIVVLCILIFSCILWGENYNKSNSASISKTADRTTFLDANNLLCFIYNDGNFAYDNANFLGKTDGLYFPRGTDKTVIYAAGLWIGAKVDGQSRATVAEYNSEYTYGPMDNGSYLPDDPEFKVYKIRHGDTPESNPDYANWPVDQGAPVDNYGEPLVLGYKTCWTVFNDADSSRHSNNAGSTDPLGLEIQHTSYAYSASGALGNTIYFRYLIINKGDNFLEDTYISLWCDPDVGGASDDLVGCDTILAIGYAYNNAGTDSDYGDYAPAVGFGLLQGPIVDGSPFDTAFYKGEWLPNKRNLSMTSFNKFINGDDPDNAEQTYNCINGLYSLGDSIIDPYNNATTYFYSGDPVMGTGWLDEFGSDKRFLLSSGPFNMNPGDTQEVVVAIIAGQGGNHLQSVAALKSNYQQIYNSYYEIFSFDIPSPPGPLELYGRAYDSAIELIWNSNAENYYQDFLDSEGQFFVFEGYNIFQGESMSGPWHKIATFDMTANESQMTFEEAAGEYVINCSGDPIDPYCDSIPRPWNFELIYNWISGQDGYPQLAVVQEGNETGIQNSFYLDQDHINGGPLLNDVPYYYAISAYSINIEDVRSEDSIINDSYFYGFNAINLESGMKLIELIPRSVQQVMYSDTADHTAGLSNGMVIAEYLDPSIILTGLYKVTFNSDDTWNLYLNDFPVLTNMENQSNNYDFPILSGIMVRVIGPTPGIAPPANDETGGVIEIANSWGPMNPPDNVFWSLNYELEYYVSSDFDGASDEARARFNWRGNVETESWEFRFTSSGSQYYNYNTDELMNNRAPFEIWHYTADESEPDRRDYFEIMDDDGSGDWSWGDRIYVVEVEYAEPLPQYAEYNWDDDFHLGRVKFNDNSGMYDAPPEGTIVRFNSTRPNTVADIFTFDIVEFMCGDVNADHEVNIGDAVYLINYIFIGGSEPVTMESAYINCDAKINLADAIYLINYIFRDGAEPCDCD